MRRTILLILLAIPLVLLQAAAAQPPAISIVEAEASVQAVYPGSVVVSLQLITRPQDQLRIWEARLDNGTIVQVDAQTGDVVGRSTSSTAPIPPVPPMPPAPMSVNQGQGAGLLGLNQALNIALTQYPGALLVSAELEPRERSRDRGPLTWDLKLNNGMAVYVDARSGQIVETEPWRMRGNLNPITTLPMIDLDQALGIARSVIGDRPFEEVDLEFRVPRHNYALAWRVDFGRGARVYIDATSGNILEVR
jgi:uncharacterized membrane protein YkoI